MNMLLKRVRQGKNSTLSELYIDGLFQCYVLEDRIRDHKIKGQTCIPAGRYRLGINYWGGMNTAYKRRFPDMHQGMIEIRDVPAFSNIYIHIGNTHADTAGCLLVGTYFHRDKNREDYEVYQSQEAYLNLYQVLIDHVKSGKVILSIENRLTGGNMTNAWKRN
ncbi:DUF5675 family protein [Sphingobacterium sp. DR205]|uniref:DUF5675 family protein n=1 Tax=Sphingobacterium sp. DR205 TaxID=2713573 RepID=UPI0013E49D20|nr:DUF5675 family protein [Sphingobacterium sp. DR205]QIH31645.1 hypothetical protein G6053_01405 [Sphingobacterium sp. DR205]